jgi:hypothetical protein
VLVFRRVDHPFDRCEGGRGSSNNAESHTTTPRATLVPIIRRAAGARKATPDQRPARAVEVCWRRKSCGTERGARGLHVLELRSRQEGESFRHDACCKARCRTAHGWEHQGCLPNRVTQGGGRQVDSVDCFRLRCSSLFQRSDHGQEPSPASRSWPGTAG